MRYDEEFEREDYDILEEGLFDKLVEKRNERKARKEEIKEKKRLEAEAEAARKKEERELKNARMRTASLTKYPIFNPSDDGIPLGELEELVGNIKFVIGREIPGVKFINKKMGHNVTQLDEGHVLHKYTVKIFEMNDYNLKKFISNSESKLIKTKSLMKDVSQNAKKYGMFDGTGTVNSVGFAADIASADLDKLVEEDFVGRIMNPIINMGFTYSRNNFVKDKDGLTYLNVKMESRHFDYAITASIRFITRPEDVVEEGLKDVFKKVGEKYKEAKDKADAQLAARIEKDRKRKLPKYDNFYGAPVSYDEHMKEFEKTVDMMKKLIKSALPGFSLSTKPIYKRETEYQDGIYKLFLSQEIMNVEEHYEKFKKKYPKRLIEKTFMEEDGNDIYEILEETIFDKVEKKGFIYQQSGLYEHPKYENLSIDSDDSTFEDISVSITIIYKKGDAVKESMEILEEGLFGNKYKKKSNKELEEEREKLRDQIQKTQVPKEIRKMYKQIRQIDNELGSRENKIKKEEQKTGVHKGTVYEGNKIKSDISKILKEVEKMLKNEAGIKEFNNNGLEICKGDDVYQLCGDDHSEFHGGTDEFCIVCIDLWDYKGGNPREIMNDSDDGWHPVNHAEEKLRLRLEKFLKDKFPHFYVCDYGGDWDTGGIEIGLRR